MYPQVLAYPALSFLQHQLQLMQAFNDIGFSLLVPGTAAGRSGPKTLDGAPLPKSLKLAFSKAADNDRISRLFAEDIKAKIDPDRYVVKRDAAVFDTAIECGGAAFLYDEETMEAHTLSIAYHVHKDKAHAEDGKHHDYTEIGTSLTRIAGFKSAQVVIAALALKEWWERHPNDTIVTEILPDNGPSLSAYHKNLRWEEIKDKAKTDELHRLCNESISPEDQGRQTIWFGCTDTVVPELARMLLNFMKQGSLVHKNKQDEIKLDLSALSGIGLTRKRLEMIADGITDRQKLGQDPQTTTSCCGGPRP